MRRGNGGFTLLEVLIALAVAGIALTAVLALARQNLTAEGRIEHTTQATLLGQQLLAELQSGVRPLPEGGQDGAFEPPDDQYRFAIRLLPTPVPGVQQVQVKISWSERDSDSVTLDSFAWQ